MLVERVFYVPHLAINTKGNLSLTDISIPHPSVSLCVRKQKFRSSTKYKPLERDNEADYEIQFLESWLLTNFEL